MINFSKETIDQVVTVIDDNMSEISSLVSGDDGLSFKEASQKLLCDKCHLTQNEAKEVVDDLMKGISDFDAQMENAPIEGSPISVKQNLEKLSEDMNDEERRNFYANVLTALQLLSSEDSSDIEGVLAENQKLGVDDLIANIEKTINDKISLEVIGEAVKNEIDADTLNQLANKIEMNKDEFRLNAALWIYILQRDGKIKLTDSEVSVPPVSIGTITAAGIETIIKTNEFKQGKITLETWQTVVKWILGIVIGILLFLAMAAISLAVGTSTYLAIVSLIGEGIVSQIVPLLIVWPIAGKLARLGKKIMLQLSEFYNRHIAGVTEKVKEIFGKAKDTLSNQAKKVIDKSTQESTHEQTQDSHATHLESENPAMA